jgi:uncharacterized protein (DUF2267 family)
MRDLLATRMPAWAHGNAFASFLTEDVRMEASAFVREVAERLRSDKSRAEAIVSLVFQELRDRLDDVATSEIAAHLPPAVQPLWVRTARHPDRVAGPYRLELLPTVMQHGALSDSAEAERAVVEVLAALQALLERVAEDTRVREIFQRLPPDLEILWIAAERTRRSRHRGRGPFD